VRPGFIYTKMHASGGEPNRFDRVKALVPMKRGGTAEEVAKAILWLLSDEASYTTEHSSMLRAESSTRAYGALRRIEVVRSSSIRGAA
jgi:NAD(P)-dependent dehydrogenase (short-subunit alcohol dehydrogenase family)